MTLWKKTYFLILSKVLFFMMFHAKMVEIPEKQVTLYVIHEYFLRYKVREQTLRGSTARIAGLYIFDRS